MGMAIGQHKAMGHSDGMLGHGGHNRVGGHGTGVAPEKNPQTQNAHSGHTMSNSHGGSFPMGC